MEGRRVICRAQKIFIISIFEIITIYVISISKNNLPLDTMAVILATFFGLVFLLPQIIGQFVLRPYSQNFYEIYSKSLYFISFVFGLGIVIPISGITFSKQLHFFGLSLLLNLHTISLFLFLNCIMLLVLFFDSIIGNLSFARNLRTLKEKSILLLIYTRKRDCKNLYQSVQEKYRHVIGKLLEYLWKDIQFHLDKISSAIESLLSVNECHITECINDIFQILEYLVNSNESEYYERVLDEIIKISSISESYTIKSATIDELTNMNLCIIQNEWISEEKEKKIDIIKKSIKGIERIGSSKSEVNYNIIILEAQKKLKMIYNECLEKELNEFDYSIFIHSLRELSHKSFNNDIREGIHECILILYQIAVSFKNKQLSINPITGLIEKMRDIGNKCAEKRWENLFFLSLNTLFQLKEELSREYQDIILFCSLIMTSYCNKYMPEALPNTQKILVTHIKDLKEIFEPSLNYARDYSQIQYSILKDYIENQYNQ
jgi:hypothetical protein